MIRSNLNYVKMAEEYETSTMSTSGMRNEPTDKHINNHDRQGLAGPNRHTSQWKSTLGKRDRDKVYFDMQPTDQQNDLNGTGNCDLWNRQVDLIRTPPLLQENT